MAYTLKELKDFAGFNSKNLMRMYFGVLVWRIRLNLAEIIYIQTAHHILGFNVLAFGARKSLNTLLDLMHEV